MFLRQLATVAALSTTLLASFSTGAFAWKNDGTPEVDNLQMDRQLDAYIYGGAPASVVTVPPEPRYGIDTPLSRNIPRRYREATIGGPSIDLEPLHRATREYVARANAKARLAQAKKSAPRHDAHKPVFHFDNQTNRDDKEAKRLHDLRPRILSGGETIYLHPHKAARLAI